MGVKRGLWSPLIFHLNEVEQHGNNKGKNRMVGSGGRESSDISVGQLPSGIGNWNKFPDYPLSYVQDDYQSNQIERWATRTVKILMH